MDGEEACRASSILLLQQCLQGAAYSHAIACCCSCSESGQELEAHWSVELWQLLLYASLARLCCLPELLKLRQHITLCRYSITSIGYCCSMGSAASSASAGLFCLHTNVVRWALLYVPCCLFQRQNCCCHGTLLRRQSAVQCNLYFHAVFLVVLVISQREVAYGDHNNCKSKTPKMCDPGLTHTKHKANEIRDKRQVQCNRCGTCKGFDRFEHSCRLSQTGMASQAPGSATRAHCNALGRLHRSSHRYWRNA
jgi:hypothetical protein